MKTILFQGDSITDVDRRSDDSPLWGEFGYGYPLLVSARLGYANPGDYHFINRGDSGDRVVDLYARIKTDAINLRPDVLSVLIGVNDVWHELNEQNGVAADKYERIYGMFIEEVREALPDIRMLLLEPFVTPGRATDPKWDVFRTEVGKRAAAVRRLSEKYDLTFVPLQDRFDAALQKAPADYWTVDGVHPTAFGHELIAEAWISAFSTL